MADDLRADLDQPLPLRGQRPVLELLAVIQCRLLAESVEELGADRFCATLVPVG